MNDVERDDLLREAVALLKAAASTADSQKAEELRERAHVLFALIDDLDAPDATLH
jgi:flagellar biosynthesis regulator FlaF